LFEVGFCAANLSDHIIEGIMILDKADNMFVCFITANHSAHHHNLLIWGCCYGVNPCGDETHLNPRNLVPGWTKPRNLWEEYSEKIENENDLVQIIQRFLIPFRSLIVFTFVLLLRSDLLHTNVEHVVRSSTDSLVSSAYWRTHPWSETKLSNLN